MLALPPTPPRKGLGMWKNKKGNNRGWNLRGETKIVFRGEERSDWKGDAATDEAKRKRARRRFQLIACETCGNQVSERHHKDGNPGNNDPSNIAILCRKCHMVADGRMGRAWRYVRPPGTPTTCMICGGVASPKKRAKGRCHACVEYFRRTGIERSFYLAQKTA